MDSNLWNGYRQLSGDLFYYHTPSEVANLVGRELGPLLSPNYSKVSFFDPELPLDKVPQVLMAPYPEGPHFFNPSVTSDYRGSREPMSHGDGDQ